MRNLSRMQVPSQNCHNWHLRAEMPRSMKLSVLRTWRTIFTRIQISTLQNKSVRVNVGAWSVAHKTRQYLLAGSNLWESQELPSSLAACTVSWFHKDIQPNPVHLHISICIHKYIYIYKHLFWKSQLALVGSGRTGDPHWSWLPVATFTMQRFVGWLKNEFKLSKLHKSKFAYPLARSADGPKSNYARMRMNDKAHSKNVWLVSTRRLRPGNLGTKPGPVLCNKLTSSNVHQSVSANNINELVSGEVRSLSPGNGCNLLESGQCVWTVADLRASTCFAVYTNVSMCSKDLHAESNEAQTWLVLNLHNAIEEVARKQWTGTPRSFNAFASVR